MSLKFNGIAKKGQLRKATIPTFGKIQKVGENEQKVEIDDF